MSRLDSARIASIKAEHAGLSLAGTAVASDAFFPFRDGLDVVVDAGATCVIQPGGSMRDQEVIDAADERGVVMVLHRASPLPALNAAASGCCRLAAVEAVLQLEADGAVEAVLDAGDDARCSGPSACLRSPRSGSGPGTSRRRWLVG